MKMTENDIIAAYVKSRYPNLIKTGDYNTYAACKRLCITFEFIKNIFKMKPLEDMDAVDLMRRVNNIEIEREEKYGRYEEGVSDGSAEAPDGIRGEENICGEPVSDTEQGSNLQED